MDLDFWIPEHQIHSTSLGRLHRKKVLSMVAAAEDEKLPPIRVMEVRAGVFLLLDGRHRLAAVREAGLPLIKARIV